MITNIEDYFEKGCGRCPRFATRDCSVQPWQEGLRDLRQVCLDAGLTETLKWAHPCYMHANRNIAIIGAYRADFRLSFFNAGLMKDPEEILVKQGPNTHHPDMIRFSQCEQVQTLQPIIVAYLKEAKSYAEAGVLPKKVKEQIHLPDELTEAMDSDPELAEAFHALTPGRQKSYIINLNTARTSPTRVARIMRFRDKILAGIGANER